MNEILGLIEIVLEGKVENLPEARYIKEIIKQKQSIEGRQYMIINHYGLDNQLDQLIEECAELILAIRKYKRYKYASENSLIAELGDVDNLIQQIKLKNTRFAEGINRNTEYKIDREISRITKE